MTLPSASRVVTLLLLSLAVLLSIAPAAASTEPRAPAQPLAQMEQQAAATDAAQQIATAQVLLPHVSASTSGVAVVSPLYHVRFVSAFVASISMILVSEFGDKTFFIAAILAMKNNRWEVFSAAIAALALMTVLSAGMGQTLPSILDPSLTHYAATALFFFFGAKLLYDASQMEAGGDLKEELEEVESELKSVELEESVGLSSGGSSIELTGSAPSSLSSPRAAAAKVAGITRRASAACTMFLRRFFSKVFLTCFTMTFLAEWGDRSQIATIALAAQKDAFGVTAGGIVGHAICTGVAVVAGKLLATRISERTISATGGALFLAFGIHSLYFGEEH